jgi:hypothetical protein
MNLYDANLKTEWTKWMLTPIQQGEDNDNLITNQQYLENVFRKLIHTFEKRGILFLVREQQILNDVMNYYFNLWKHFKRRPYTYDILTSFGREQQAKNSLPTTEMIDYLDRIFTDSFWELFKYNNGVNAGLFDCETSDFGSIFWTDIRYFLYPYINPINIKNHLSSSQYSVDYDKKLDEMGVGVGGGGGGGGSGGPGSGGDDPYIIDQINSRKAGIYE